MFDLEDKFNVTVKEAQRLIREEEDQTILDEDDYYLAERDSWWASS